MTERTLIIIKPDAVQRHLVGELISRLERKGFKIIAAKFLRIDEPLARRHYAPHKGESFYEGVVKYLASLPVLVMVWEAPGIIAMSRAMMGKTFGFDAEPGTIRGDYSLSTRYNLIHGSDGPESARREIALYFKPEELVEYDFADADWIRGPQG